MTTMDTTMELDELKQAWQLIGQRLERQESLQWQLLRERKLERVRRGLRPLAWGQGLQALLGIGLVVLGVACWTRNTDIPGLFWAGVLVHAFGVAHVALAGITLGLIGTIDYAAPVLRIQKQMARLRCFYSFNANVCGAPWWVMWVVVVIAFAGLGQVDPAAGTPLWIQLNLALGLVGWLATYAWSWTASRRARQAGRDDGLLEESGAIRRGRALLDEIAEFERG
jgi:hypothetical protein